MTGITPAWAGKRSSHPSGSSMAWDHPRVGGEKEKKGVKQCGMTGSPPRGRGKGCHFEYCQKGVRITPAWAGKSKAETGEQACPEDHPRVGGEKHRREVLRKRYKGSPPRGRGKDPSRCPPLRPVWITPAWAGKSRKCTPSQPAGQDHPRVGGEKHTEQRATAHVWGSPPRGRGKGPRPENTPVLTRITPAWAGKRVS